MNEYMRRLEVLVGAASGEQKGEGGEAMDVDAEVDVDVDANVDRPWRDEE
jgi:hypothetical protein